jgi:hypothetical protein
MDARLAPLAVRLQACRRRGNRRTLECVLESAKILAEAKAISRRDFGIWLRERAHMDRGTANRYLRVAGFVRRNVSLMTQISNLSLTKICALSSLDSATAARLLSGRERLSAPMDQLSDIEFHRELRGRHPAPRRRMNRENVFRQTWSLLIRLEKALFRAKGIRARMSPHQRNRIVEKVAHLSRAVAGWRATVA